MNRVMGEDVRAYLDSLEDRSFAAQCVLIDLFVRDHPDTLNEDFQLAADLWQKICDRAEAWKGTRR